METQPQEGGATIGQESADLIAEKLLKQLDAQIKNEVAKKMTYLEKKSDQQMAEINRLRGRQNLYDFYIVVSLPTIALGSLFIWNASMVKLFIQPSKQYPKTGELPTQERIASAQSAQFTGSISPKQFEQLKTLTSQSKSDTQTT